MDLSNLLDFCVCDFFVSEARLNFLQISDGLFYLWVGRYVLFRDDFGYRAWWELHRL